VNDKEAIREVVAGAIGTHALASTQRWIGAAFLFAFAAGLSFGVGSAIYNALDGSWRALGVVAGASTLLFAIAAIWNDVSQVLVIEPGRMRCIAPLRSWEVAVADVVELRIRRNRKARILVIKTSGGRRYDFPLNPSLVQALGPFADT
jgi:hypothetical protein